MKTNTTSHLKPTPAPTPRATSWHDQLPLPPAMIVAVLVLIVVAGIAAIGRLGLHSSAAAMPTPALAPIIIIASPLPVVPPTAIPPAAMVAAQLPANVTRRAIVVYADHDPATVIGAVEAGRPYQLVARWGADWLTVDMTSSGVVFARTADLLDLPADLVDLQPAPAPQVIDVAAQPAAPAEAAPTPATIYHSADTPPPAEATPLPQQVVIFDRQQWALDAQRARQQQNGTP